MIRVFLRSRIENLYGQHGWYDHVWRNTQNLSLICIGRGSGRCIVDTNAEAVARVEAKWKRDFDMNQRSMHY
ncbi:hypothetical protein Tco_0295217 [Tanacetum coccineum]